MKANFDWIEQIYDEEFIMGIDEVGRGPLFGGVLSAAVIMPKHRYIVGVNDSKKLSEKNRKLFFNLIWKEALAIGVGYYDNNIIDNINILEATNLAMIDAYEEASIFKMPELVLVDAVKLNISSKQESIVHGDEKSYNIACASIVAKVLRDNLCYGWNKIYPNYAILKNKGYGTKEHIEAIKKYGITNLHRRSFLKKYEKGE